MQHDILCLIEGCYIQKAVPGISNLVIHYSSRTLNSW